MITVQLRNRYFQFVIFLTEKFSSREDFGQEILLLKFAISAPNVEKRSHCDRSFLKKIKRFKKLKSQIKIDDVKLRLDVTITSLSSQKLYKN